MAASGSFSCKDVFTLRDRLRNGKARAAGTPQATAAKQHKSLAGLMEVLREDSKNLFNDRGMDLSIYSPKVDFKDPITRYDSIEGFTKNLAFLKQIFNPTYDMLDIRQINETDVEARWSMGFDVLPIKNSPLGKFWQPRLEFTGTTVYGTDGKTGAIDRHIDTWDSVQNQVYFSLEAFGDVLSQIFNFQRTPQLPGPAFTLLKRKKAYSIREYGPFNVAEAETGESGPAGNGGPAFGQLAKFLFGGNASSKSLTMTTPVITSSGGPSGSGTMQFVLPLDDLSKAPAPLPESPVRLKTVAGGLYACCRFAGKVDNELANTKRRELQLMCERDGLQVGEDFLLLRYNDPSVAAPFRRNEVLLPVTGGFDLWTT